MDQIWELAKSEKEKIILTELKKKYNLNDRRALLEMLVKEFKSIGIHSGKWLEQKLLAEETKPMNPIDFFNVLVLPLAYPSLPFCGGHFKTPTSFFWKARMAPLLSLIKKWQTSVGRFWITGGDSSKTVSGTGFRLGKDYFLTTNKALWEFSSPVKGKNIEQRLAVDFCEEKKPGKDKMFAIEKSIYTAEKGQPTLTILKLAPKNQGGEPCPPPLQLADLIPQKERMVATIGYPNSLRGVSHQLALKATFGPSTKMNIKRISPGHCQCNINTGPKIELEHDCRVIAGSTGSPIIDLENGKVLGVHYKSDIGTFKPGLGIDAAYIKQVMVKRQLF